jgi:hypothetical protein
MSTRCPSSLARSHLLVSACPLPLVHVPTNVNRTSRGPQRLGEFFHPPRDSRLRRCRGLRRCVRRRLRRDTGRPLGHGVGRSLGRVIGQLLRDVAGRRARHCARRCLRHLAGRCLERNIGRRCRQNVDGSPAGRHPATTGEESEGHHGGHAYAAKAASHLRDRPHSDGPFDRGLAKADAYCVSQSSHRRTRQKTDIPTAPVQPPRTNCRRGTGPV